MITITVSIPEMKTWDFTNMIGIYKIRNTESNLVYFGQSQDIEKRIKYHFYELQRGNHHNYLLQNDFSRGDKLEWEVVEECTIENINDRERTYLRIAEMYSQFYYNICYYPETCRGIKRSAESCAKISAALIGKKFSAEHCAKKSAAMKGNKRGAANKGKKHSAESCAKMKGKKRSAESCAKMSAIRKEYWKNKKNANK